MYFSSDTPVRFLTLRRIKRPFASIYNILLNVALVICTDDILNREILSVEGSIALVGQRIVSEDEVERIRELTDGERIV